MEVEIRLWELRRQDRKRMVFGVICYVTAVEGL
jgi:hypothetical protein